jgi:F0F1-type ATP synthase membrane subunit b/b'
MASTKNTPTGTQNGTVELERLPTDQALQAVDIAFGTAAKVADAVVERVKPYRDRAKREKELKSLRGQVEKELKDAKERGGEIRRQVTGQLDERTREVRQRVEPVYRERVEPVQRRVESRFRERV